MCRVYENKICSKLIQLNSNENWRDVMVRCQHVSNDASTIFFLSLMIRMCVYIHPVWCLSRNALHNTILIDAIYEEEIFYLQ